MQVLLYIPGKQTIATSQLVVDVHDRTSLGRGLKRNTIHIDAAALEGFMTLHGLNQYQLAEKLGVQRQTVSSWIHQGRMRRDNFDHVVEFFSIEPEALERQEETPLGWDSDALAAALETVDIALERLKPLEFDYRDKAIVIEQCYQEATHNRDSQLFSTANRVLQILTKSKGR